MNTKLNISGKIYDNIGTLNFGNRTFLFIMNGNDIKVVEAKKIENTLKYVIPSFKFDVNNLVALKQNYITISIASSLKNDIESGKITDKKELVKRLADAENILKNDEQINSMINSKEQNIDDFRKHVKKLLSYFDERVKQDKSKMNLQNVSSFQIQNNDGFKKEYIKKTDNADNVEILENIDSKDFGQQFRETQNEFTSLGLQDGLQSADQTFNWMRDHDKVNVSLNKMDDVREVKDRDTLTSYNAMNSNEINNGKRDLVVNPNSGIYIDKKSGDVMTTKVEGNKVEILRVNEQTDNPNQKDDSISKVDTNKEGAFPNLAIDSKTKIETTSNHQTTDIDLSIDEIEKILVQYRDKLTPEQINDLQNALEQKEEQSLKQETSKRESMPKRLSLILKEDKQAAFSDVFMLCIIADIGVLGLLLGVLYMLK